MPGVMLIDPSSRSGAIVLTRRHIECSTSSRLIAETKRPISSLAALAVPTEERNLAAMPWRYRQRPMTAMSLVVSSSVRSTSGPSSLTTATPPSFTSRM